MNESSRPKEIARVLGAVLLGLGLVAAAPVGAGASDLGLEEYGGRLGLSVDPDQLTLGMYADWGELGTQTHLVTSADLGFGDHVFTFIVNGDVFYRFTNTSGTLVPYAGGGIGIAYYDFDIDVPAGFPQPDDTTTEVGLNLVGGIWKDLGGYRSGSLELRLGLSDVPDFKVTAQLGFF